MARRRKPANKQRAQLGKLNTLREALWDAYDPACEIAEDGYLDFKVFQSQKDALLNTIYDANTQLKIAIFDEENPHLL